jgi:hypothetical protein
MIEYRRLAFVISWNEAGMKVLKADYNMWIISED